MGGLPPARASAKRGLVDSMVNTSLVGVTWSRFVFFGLRNLGTGAAFDLLILSILR